MRISNDKKLDYKDVSIVPIEVSEIEHRDGLNTFIDFCGANLRIPLIGSPMPDVCDGNMASELAKNGAFGFIHRFQTIDEQIDAFRSSKISGECGCAIGVTGDFYERFSQLYDYGCRIFCLDTANGGNIQVKRAFEKLTDDVKVVAGNIASAECFKWLSELGIHGIRVGIAGGSVCETKTETGVYHPMISCITECAEIKNKFNLTATLIADGGIKIPADMCKAIIAGANVCMVGSVLAGCEESPSKVLKLDGRLYKVLRGAASFSVQRSQDKIPTFVEGRETLVEYKGKVAGVLNRFLRGLQSSMSYVNAQNLAEYQSKAYLIRL